MPFITRHIPQPAERGEAVARVRISESGSIGISPLPGASRKLSHGQNLYTAPPPAAGVPDVVRKGFMTAEACGTEKSYVLKIKFQTLTDLQDAHRAMLSTTPSPTIDVAAVAWAWKSDGMTGWALGHCKPTPENTHKFHERNTVVRPLVFGDAITKAMQETRR